ncbi:pilus assembly protein PilP [Pseudomonas sp. zfem004]|uniref:pilus assembly protein PilP n=1 Tax=Pseudomonas sp. zfem004 TaxID=3078199 RepID=UPI002929402D|nr:pilus assembly protein PilP [Pseudomonas sp. zfem004]MDU9402979.1 pilus assembly protein PilP [Pseudomonas sp. zfem004]
MRRTSLAEWQVLLQRSAVLRAVLVLALAATVVVVGYQVSLREQYEHHRAHALLEQQLQEKLVAREGQAAELEPERQALNDDEQRLSRERWRLAAGEGVSELLDQLAVSGHQHGLLVERLDVLEERQQAGYRVMPLDISVVGRYPALRAWLEQWLQQVRLLNVARLELLAVDERSGLVRAKLQVHAYTAAPGQAVAVSLADERARQAVSARQFDPFLAWTSRVAPQGIGRVPLEQLEMVGSLSRAGQRHALLRSAGHLYRVAVGDRLGRDDGVVVRIDAHQVEVHERLYIAGGWQERSRFLALGKGAHGEVRDEDESVVERGSDAPAGLEADADAGV